MNLHAKSLTKQKQTTNNQPVNTIQNPSENVATTNKLTSI